MVVPKPFPSGRFVMGAPLHVRRCGGHAYDWQALETARQQLASSLIDLGDRAMPLATGQMWRLVSPAKDQIIPRADHTKMGTKSWPRGLDPEDMTPKKTKRQTREMSIRQRRPFYVSGWQADRLSDGL